MLMAEPEETYDAEAVRLRMNEETMRSRKGTDNALYNVETEAALLARDMARLRPRLRLLEKNLNHPRHADEAMKYLDLALQEVAAI